MIPVIDLKQLRAAVANQSPETRRYNTLKSRALITAAIKANDDYRQRCIELGIPYLECVAAIKHPMAKYSR